MYVQISKVASLSVKYEQTVTLHCQQIQKIIRKQKIDITMK